MCKWRCYIEVDCEEETEEDFICELCERHYCESHSAVYDQFTQLDFNCCSECAELRREY